MQDEATHLTIGLRKTVFNATMRDARKAKSLSLGDLAMLVGLTFASGKSSRASIGSRLGSYERMHSVPPREMAQEIADALEVSLQDIFPEVLRSMPRAKAQEIRMPVAEMQLPSGAHGEIMEVLGTIRHRERRVLVERYGLNGEEPKTLEEVGKVFGVSKERIRQIEAKALRYLRHPSRSKALREVLEEYE